MEQRVSVNEVVVGSILTQSNIWKYFHPRSDRQSTVLDSTKHAMSQDTAKSGEQSVLTLVPPHPTQLHENSEADYIKG